MVLIVTLPVVLPPQMTPFMESDVELFWLATATKFPKEVALPVDYITMASTGNGTFFGNLGYSTQGGMLMSCCGSQGGL